jgi:hypothetical protein
MERCRRCSSLIRSDGITRRRPATPAPEPADQTRLRQQMGLDGRIAHIVFIPSDGAATVEALAVCGGYVIAIPRSFRKSLQRPGRQVQEMSQREFWA